MTPSAASGARCRPPLRRRRLRRGIAAALARRTPSAPGGRGSRRRRRGAARALRRASRPRTRRRPTSTSTTSATPPTTPSSIAARSRVPGVAVLHEWSLHHLVLHETVERGDLAAYLREMRRAHGERGDVRGPAGGARARRRSPARALPALDRVLERSLAVVALTAAVTRAGRAPAARPAAAPPPASPRPAPRSSALARRGAARAGPARGRARGHRPRSGHRQQGARGRHARAGAGFGATSRGCTSWSRATATRGCRSRSGPATPGSAARGRSPAVSASPTSCATSPPPTSCSPCASRPTARCRAPSCARWAWAGPALVTAGTPAADEFPEGVVVPVGPGPARRGRARCACSRTCWPRPRCARRSARLARAHVRAAHDLEAVTGRLVDFLERVDAQKDALAAAVAAERRPRTGCSGYLTEEVRGGARDLGLVGDPAGPRRAPRAAGRRAPVSDRRPLGGDPRLQRGARACRRPSTGCARTSPRGGAHPRDPGRRRRVRGRHRGVARAAAGATVLAQRRRTAARATPCGAACWPRAGRAAAHDRRRPLHADRGPGRGSWPRLDEGYDVAIASRALPARNIEVRQPGYRESMGRLFNLVVRVLARPRPARHPVRLQALHRRRRRAGASGPRGWTASPSTWRRCSSPAGAGCRIAEVPGDLAQRRGVAGRAGERLPRLPDLARIRVNGWRGLYR